MALCAIDPGTEQSAYVVLADDGRTIIEADIVSNPQLIDRLTQAWGMTRPAYACEMVASYGLPVGKETFETVLWIGRFVQAVSPRPMQLITRAEIKMALCHQTRGVNDSVLRRRLIDLYGPSKEKAIGNKRQPGPLYGLKADMWSALAVGIAALSTTINLQETPSDGSALLH